MSLQRACAILPLFYDIISCLVLGYTQGRKERSAKSFWGKSMKVNNKLDVYFFWADFFAYTDRIFDFPRDDYVLHNGGDKMELFPSFSVLFLLFRILVLVLFCLPCLLLLFTYLTITNIEQWNCSTITPHTTRVFIILWGVCA